MNEKCPISSNECNEKCGWYDASMDCCVIQSIANALWRQVEEEDQCVAQ